MTDQSNLGAACDGEPIPRDGVRQPLTNRELGFVAGGPIADTFFDALPDDELRRWKSA